MTTNKLLSVEATSKYFDYPLGGLRRLLFDRNKNGLDAAVLKVGRKLFIDKEVFESWLLGHREVPDLGMRALENR